MTLEEALAAMEVQPSGVGNVPPLDVTSVDRLRKTIRENGGLPVSLDCRDKTLASSDDELAQVILPLCAWLRRLADALCAENTKGDMYVVEHSACYVLG